MIRKPISKKEASKPVKAVKAVKAVKDVKSIKAHKPTRQVKKLSPSVGRAAGDSSSTRNSKDKLTDEAYDRGFNDGYAKGLEDCGLDESR